MTNHIANLSPPTNWCRSVLQSNCMAMAAVANAVPNIQKGKGSLFV